MIARNQKRNNKLVITFKIVITVINTRIYASHRMINKRLSKFVGGSINKVV